MLKVPLYLKGDYFQESAKTRSSRLRSQVGSDTCYMFPMLSMFIPSQSKEYSTGKENWWSGVPKMIAWCLSGLIIMPFSAKPPVRNLDLMKNPLFEGSRIHSRVIKLFVISVGVNIKVLYVVV